MEESMKSVLKSFMGLLLITSLLPAQPAGGGGEEENHIMHSQNIHQYIVLEAFKVLEAAAPRVALKLKDHIGTMNTSGAPWSQRTIAAGAYREDEEDVCYAYGGPIASYDPDMDMTKPGWCIGEVYYQIEDRLRKDADYLHGLVTTTLPLRSPTPTVTKSGSPTRDPGIHPI